MTDWREFMLWWLAALLASASIVGGRLGRALFLLATDPPDDLIMAKHWERRRRWLAYSELLALPAFATISVSVVAYHQLDPIISVLIAMFLGFVGFAMLLDGAQWLFRKRLGMPQPALATPAVSTPNSPPGGDQSPQGG